MPQISSDRSDVTGFFLGDLARLLGVDVRRVEKWARVGWIKPLPDTRDGRRHVFAPVELEIARRALRTAKYFGHAPNERIFTLAREKETREPR